MSSLGLSLLILIVLFIVAVVASNYWMNRRHRGQRALSPGRPGGRHDHQRAEPSLADFDGPSSPDSIRAASGSNPPPVADADKRRQPAMAAGSSRSIPDPVSRSAQVPGAGGTRRVHDPSEWRAAIQEAQAKGGQGALAPTGTSPAESPSAVSGEDSSRHAPFTPDPGDDDADLNPPSRIQQAVERFEQQQAAEPTDGPDLPPLVHADSLPAINTPAPAGQSDHARRPGQPGGSDPVQRIVAPGATRAGSTPPQTDPGITSPATHPANARRGDLNTEQDIWAGVDPLRAHAKFATRVDLELRSITPGERLLAVLGHFDRVGSKPVQVRGSAESKFAHALEPITRAGAYDHLCFDLLQVNRQGPVNAMEYSEFVSRLGSISEQLDVLVNPPDMNVVLVRSRVLDAEVSALDAQVAVNVRRERPIALEQFEEIAQRLALARTDKGGYQRVGADGLERFSIHHVDDPGRIVFLLDVPRVPRAAQPIREMVECAWEFAKSLDAQMVDDSGRLIDNALFEKVESQLDLHYQALLSAGLPAGSGLARQVFN